MRQIQRLTDLQARRATTSGLYADGGGLYLQVRSATARSWLFRFTLRGKSREMGLGTLAGTSLAEARREADRCRQLCRQGIDPIEERRSKTQSEATSKIRFMDCAAAFIALQRAAGVWRNEKHGHQWNNTLETYVAPFVREKPINVIDVPTVLEILEPIWVAKPETARRVRGRLERILDWAKAKGYRTGDNPAAWRGHLENLLPTRPKSVKQRHHPALPYQELPQFMEQLAQRGGAAARALEFAILTAARTGEVLGAKRTEVTGAVWTIPPERMKTFQLHKVPLSDVAVSLVQRFENSGYLFPATSTPDKSLSNAALLAVLKRMHRSDLTVHGFRSTFRDWAAECTDYPREVIEMALAHSIDNKVEAAYRRGDLFEKRRRLMDDWAAFCHSFHGNTVLRFPGTRHG
jgi:integrase